MNVFEKTKRLNKFLCHFWRQGINIFIDLPIMLYYLGSKNIQISCFRCMRLKKPSVSFVNNRNVSNYHFIHTMVYPRSNLFFDLRFDLGFHYFLSTADRDSLITSRSLGVSVRSSFLAVLI